MTVTSNHSFSNHLLCYLMSCVLINVHTCLFSFARSVINAYSVRLKSDDVTQVQRKFGGVSTKIQ